MQFNELLNILYPFRPINYMTSDYDAMIHSWTMCKYAAAAVPDVLLVAESPEDIAHIDFPDTSNTCTVLLLKKASDLPPNISTRQINLICLDAEPEVHEVTSIIVEKFAMDQRIHISMRTLTNSLFANRGTQYILNNAHLLLKNPIIMTGVSNDQILCSFQPEEIEALPILGTLSSEIKAGRLKATDLMIRNDLFQKDIKDLLRSKLHSEVIHHRNTNLNMNQMSCSLKVKNVDVGYITVLALNHNFLPYDEEILRRLNIIISQELQKKSLYTHNRNEAKAQFLNHLITSTTISEDYIYLMTQIRNIVEIREKFYVAVIESSTSSEANIDNSVFDTMVDKLKPLLRDSFYVIRDTELVLLFNLPEKTDIHQLIGNSFSELCAKSGLTMGVSNMFRDLKQTKKHYHMAKRAVSFVSMFNEDTVNFFSDIAPKEMLYILNKQEDLLSFCMPELLDLLNYDKEYGSDLMLTLYVYLEHFGKTVSSAAALFIHKNTLLYRISKIREILHCDLEKGEDVYKLMLSLRIFRILQIWTLPED